MDKTLKYHPQSCPKKQRQNYYQNFINKQGNIPQLQVDYIRNNQEAYVENIQRQHHSPVIPTVRPPSAKNLQNFLITRTVSPSGHNYTDQHYLQKPTVYKPQLPQAYPYGRPPPIVTDNIIIKSLNVMNKPTLFPNTPGAFRPPRGSCPYRGRSKSPKRSKSKSPTQLNIKAKNSLLLHQKEDKQKNVKTNHDEHEKEYYEATKPPPTQKNIRAGSLNSSSTSSDTSTPFPEETSQFKNELQNSQPPKVPQYQPPVEQISQSNHLETNDQSSNGSQPLTPTGE